MGIRNSNGNQLMNSKGSVYEKRGYVIGSVSHAKKIALGVIGTWELDEEINFGLPEVDDRYHVWRVPIVDPPGSNRLGEIVVDAKTGAVDASKSTSLSTVQARLHLFQGRDGQLGNELRGSGKAKKMAVVSALRNTILCGPSEDALAELPSESVQLMFTSPPYFNARPDYSEYGAYEDYLHLIRKVVRQTHRLLEDGRFAVMNCSPVLLRRARRSESSKRIAVPFDIHRIFDEEGFDFIDDIIWEKPSGAGWATGRGRRFAADRNPLQYKAVPVTEYVLVYRKRTAKLIDWHIRNHPDPEVVLRSKVADGYEQTNIWRIKPAHSKEHPAIFPLELAEKVIRYYSFEKDVVLDPFAGSGTVGAAAVKTGRRFVLSEMKPEYIELIRRNCSSWLGKSAKNVNCINCSPIDTKGELL